MVRWNVIPQPSVALAQLGGGLVIALVRGLPGQFGTEHGVNCDPVRRAVGHPHTEVL
jgi:hypothetical protein